MATKTKMTDPTKKRNHSKWVVKTIIALIGVTLSIALHELFHVIVHWDQVPHIGLFPNHATIAEIAIRLPQGYDIEGEEMVAYAITLLVILATAMIIFKIDDANDHRTSAEILFPGDKEMQKLNPHEMLALVDRADMAEAHKTTPMTATPVQTPPSAPVVKPKKESTKKITKSTKRKK